MLATLAAFFFPVIMAFAAATDLFTMRIANWLVLLLAAGFLVLALALQLPLDLVGMHLLCGLAVLAVTFALFALRWIGGGDAKLAAATALWLGFAVTPNYLVYTALFGGVLTLGILAMRRLPLETVYAGRQSLDWLGRLHDRKTGVPYGIAMAFAGLLVYPQTVIFQRLLG
jgi:prepilin peptidase CpaA